MDIHSSHTKFIRLKHIQREGDSMAHIQITSEENQILIAVLRSYLSELRMEIADTDQYEFKQNLKRQKEILLRILDSLCRQDHSIFYK